MPEGYISAHPYPDTTYRLKDAAENNMLIVVRCAGCRRMVRYLAADLATLLDGNRDAYEPPFACSKCGTAQSMKVSMHSPMAGTVTSSFGAQVA